MSDDCEIFGKMILQRIQDIGRAQEKIQMILRDEFFKKISAEKKTWSHPDPEVEKRFEEISGHIEWLWDELWQIRMILANEKEEL